MLRLETLSALDNAFPCCPSCSWATQDWAPLRLLVVLHRLTSLSESAQRKSFRLQGLAKPTEDRAELSGVGTGGGAGGAEREEQPEEEQPFTLRCSSSDWLRVSAASLEQKVKVDCSVNVEAADKYPCLQLEVERQRQLQQVVGSAGPAHRAWLEDIGGSRADSHTRMACEIMPLRR